MVRGFHGTPLDSPVTKVGLPLIAVPRDGTGYSSGTACLIAPWLAMTARHVIEDYSRQLDGAPPPAGYSERTYQ